MHFSGNPSYFYCSQMQWEGLMMDSNSFSCCVIKNSSGAYKRKNKVPEGDYSEAELNDFLLAHKLCFLGKFILAEVVSHSCQTGLP